MLAPLDEGDLDEDGLLDTEEDELARKYAPLVILDRRDENRPASIPWLLQRTHVAPGPGFEMPAAVRGGASDPRDWTAYVHVFPRADGGVNLQYWFFYPYNDGPLFFDHDSDWEHLTVRLDAKRRPLGAYLARHTDDHPGPFRAWSRLHRSGNHPVVLSALGSHATYADASDVAWYDSASSCVDPKKCSDPMWRTWEHAENVGESFHPLVSSDAFAYAGRWGSEHFFPGTSAPFGPLHHRGFCAGGSRACTEPSVANAIADRH